MGLSQLSQIVQGRQKRVMPLGKAPPSRTLFAETVNNIEFNSQGGRYIPCPFH